MENNTIYPNNVFIKTIRKKPSKQSVKINPINTTFYEEKKSNLKNLKYIVMGKYGTSSQKNQQKLVRAFHQLLQIG